MARTRVRRYQVDLADVVNGGLTPGQLRKASRARQTDAMRLWFSERFEDPVHRNPYISAEGGYQYIWGGPFDAHDKLAEEFGGIVPDHVIEALADELAGESPTWTSTPQPSDYDDGGRPAFADESFADADFLDGDPGPTLTEGQRRARVLASIAEAERALDAVEPSRSRIGHNQPPEPIDEAPLVVLAPDEIRSARTALAGVRDEVEADQPNEARVVSLLERLGSLSSKVFRALPKLMGEETVKIATAGVLGAAWPHVHEALRAVISTAEAWIPSLMPF